MQIVRQPVKAKKDMDGAITKMWDSGVKFDSMSITDLGRLHDTKAVGL